MDDIMMFKDSGVGEGCVYTELGIIVRMGPISGCNLSRLSCCKRCFETVLF